MVKEECLPKKFLLLLSTLFLVACLSGKRSIKAPPSKNYSHTASTHYELSISKPTFTEGESIKIKTKLTYVGYAKIVTIYH